MSMFYVQKGLNDFGLDAANKFLIYETLLDAQSLFLTPNTESVYGMQFLDLKHDGPTIVEVPPGLLGGFSTMWQQSLIGLGPTGVDQGKGGKFLLLPPDYEGEPPGGYFNAKSPTYGVWLGVRGFLVNGKSNQAVALMKTIRIYPLARAGDSPAMTFLNGSGKAIDTIFPDTYEYFESLAALIEKEPVDAIPPSERFLLASIGIEKGRSFTPDIKTKQLLAEAARAGAAMAQANTFASRDPMAQVYPDRRWEWAFVGGSATRDASGTFLDGGKNYRFHVPPNVPVKLFWSVVVYDALSRSELQFAGKTGFGDFPDALAEIDAHVGEILDAIDELRIRDNTVVVFTSDNGPEAMHPWQGSPGPWRGYYFTHMKGSLRVPCIIRWPGRIAAGRVSNEIVHEVDTYTTFAKVAGASVPQFASSMGSIQTDFLLGKSEKSNREGFPVFVADRLEAVKWKNWKVVFYDEQRDWWTPPPSSASQRRSISAPIRRKNTRRRDSGTHGLQVRP